MDHTKLLEIVQPEGAQDDESCLTFVMNGEDHTLGNSLRHMIMKNPETQFCGYNIPHPSENKINVRIQTHGVNAKDVYKTGLSDLSSVCEHILSTFEEAVKNYREMMKDNENRGSQDDDGHLKGSSDESNDDAEAMDEG